MKWSHVVRFHSLRLLLTRWLFNVTDTGWTIKKTPLQSELTVSQKKICSENHQHKRLVVTGHTGPDQESSLTFCSGEQSRERRPQKSRAFIKASAISDKKIRRQMQTERGADTFRNIWHSCMQTEEAAQLIQARASSPHFCRVMLCSAWLQNPTVRFITDTKGTVLQMAGINGSFRTSAVSRIGSKIN